MTRTKKKPPKTPSPKKRTAGVEVVKVKGFILQDAHADLCRGMGRVFYPVEPRGCARLPATLTYHIHKRRSSK